MKTERPGEKNKLEKDKLKIKVKVGERSEDLPAREECIRRTVERSKEQFLLAESGKMLPYHSFLYIQLQLMKKRWWFLQLLVLAALWGILPLADDILYAYRSMGVAATLFIILIIPEFWKNRTNQCMEIEAVTYYSLRQIYAARLLLFGIVDITLLTVFCGAASMSLRISLAELLRQFLFPMAVTACICFGILCSKRIFSEAAAVGLCILWSGFWWLLLLDERLYAAVTVPVWTALFGLSLLFLIFAAYRFINQYSKIWEGNLYGIKND